MRRYAALVAPDIVPENERNPVKAKTSAKEKAKTKPKVAAKRSRRQDQDQLEDPDRGEEQVRAKMAVWHSTNPMPRSATFDERVQWHVEHSTKCGCREIPKRILVELKKRGMAAASVKGRNLQKTRRLRRTKFS